MLSITREVYNIVSLPCVQGHTVGPYLKPDESKPSCYVSIKPECRELWWSACCGEGSAAGSAWGGTSKSERSLVTSSSLGTKMRLMRRKWWGSKFYFIGAPELITRTTNKKIKSMTVKFDLAFVFVKVVLGFLNKFYHSDRRYPVWQCWPLEAPGLEGGWGSNAVPGSPISKRALVFGRFPH